jgi:YesN/AraC family two-component response regulator
MNAGFTDYLTKPVDRAALIEKLHTLCMRAVPAVRQQLNSRL